MKDILAIFFIGEDMIEYKTGGKRSSRVPRYDLIPGIFINRLAKRFTGNIETKDGGAAKYGEYNWEKGLPTSDVINHIIEHLLEYQDTFRNSCKAFQGDMSHVARDMESFSKIEDHLAGAAFGIAVLMYQEAAKGMIHDDSFTNSFAPVNEQGYTPEEPLPSFEAVERFLQANSNNFTIVPKRKKRGKK